MREPPEKLPYYESDGGPTHDRVYPRTHYVIDPRLDQFNDDNYRRDFQTKREALAYLATLRVKQ